MAAETAPAVPSRPIGQQVWCYGDSLTEGYSLDAGEEFVWRPYAGFLPEVSANRLSGTATGYSGKRTFWLRSNLERSARRALYDGEEGGALEPQRTVAFALMAGTNDCADFSGFDSDSEAEDDEHMDPAAKLEAAMRRHAEAIVERLVEIADAAISIISDANRAALSPTRQTPPARTQQHIYAVGSAQPATNEEQPLTVVFMTIPPMGLRAREFKRGPQTVALRKFANDAIRVAADEFTARHRGSARAVVADVHGAVADAEHPGFMAAECDCGDGLHMSAEGYRRVARVVAEAILGA